MMQHDVVLRRPEAAHLQLLGFLVCCRGVLSPLNVPDPRHGRRWPSPPALRL